MALLFGVGEVRWPSELIFLRQMFFTIIFLHKKRICVEH